MDVFNIVANDFDVKKSGSCSRVFDIAKLVLRKLVQLMGVQWYNEPGRNLKRAKLLKLQSLKPNCKRLRRMCKAALESDNRLLNVPEVLT